MQVKSFLSSALLLGVIALSPAINTNEVAAQSSQKKPYCTVASNKGAFWWTWTQSTINQSCKTARSKVAETGQSVNRVWKRSYKTNYPSVASSTHSKIHPLLSFDKNPHQLDG